MATSRMVAKVTDKGAIMAVVVVMVVAMVVSGLLFSTETDADPHSRHAHSPRYDAQANSLH
jgi:hypothetical protein